jgi:hypothetical protein
MKTMQTLIHCGHNTTLRQHAVRLHPDDTIDAECPNAIEQAERLEAAVMLGHRPPTVTGCIHLIALLRNADAIHKASTRSNVYGTPMRDLLGPLYSLWERYGTNRLVEEAVERARVRHESGHSEAIRLAGAALRRSKLPGQARKARIVVMPMLPDDVAGSHTIADFPEQNWTIPISPTWKTDVYDLGYATIDGLFICGTADKPGIYWAVHNRGDHGYIMPVFINPRTKRLGEIAPGQAA